MKWTDRLKSDVFERLCNCHSRKDDIESLVDAKWESMKEVGKDKDGFTREDALISVLELLEDNGQSFDLTVEEYENLTGTKWRHVGLGHEEFIQDFIKFFSENNIECGKPFLTGGIWQVPYMPISKEQEKIALEFIIQRIEENQL